MIELLAVILVLIVVLKIIKWFLSRLACFACWLWGRWVGGPIAVLESVTGDTLVDRLSGQVVRQPPTCGDGVGENRHAVITAGLMPTRLRRRAVWACRLETVLGIRNGHLSKLMRGRWTPDLPSADMPSGLNVVLSQFEDGAILLGGGEVPTTGEVNKVYYIVELSDGTRLVCFPELLSRLASYALLRQRDAVLLSAVKLRALDWCKSVGLSDELRLLVVADAIRAVFERSPLETSLGDSLEAFKDDPPRWFHRA